MTTDLDREEVDVSEQGQNNQHRVRDIAQAVTIALLLWFGMTTMQTHDSVIKNTQSLEQVKQSSNAVQTLQIQVATMQSELSDLQTRQSKDDAFRESRAAMKPWTHQ